MPYRIELRETNLLWVMMYGHLELDEAETYYHEVWQLLDRCPRPTDLLVDGRELKRAGHTARRRSEQVMHHPHMGNMAFIVGQQHMLLFAPLMRVVSGIGLFGSEHEALDFLRASRGLLPPLNLEAATPLIEHEVFEAALSKNVLSDPQATQAPADDAPPTAPPDHALHFRHRRIPANPAHTLHRLTDMVNGLTRSIESLVESVERPRREQ